MEFYEPEEEQANAEPTQGQQSADEGDQGDDTAQQTEEPADQSEEPNEDADEADDEANQAADQVIELKGGEKVPLEELKLGYMRERDYRHKTQEVANNRRTLEAMSSRVTNTVGAIADYLISQLPAEPPGHLAIHDPSEYVRQKAMFDQGLAGVQRLIAMANDPQAVTEKLKTDVSQEKLAEEHSKLIEAFPQLAKPEVKEKFFRDAFEAGRELGFSDQEISDFSDHRYLKVMHYALKGLQADKAKVTAMQKVNNAPPATPKGKAQSKAAVNAKRNQDAVNKLSKTGSIKDAMNIDFD
ncbi:hypothetical protein ACQZ4Z_12995 [Agrobacterium vitis]|uniref:hypothetical protein n=1 Tax=Agrobacterium vitis TaxID=373 RepID=UPI001F44CF2B|nr:hypothetical protein [Agrobacterium vitis]